MRKKDPAIIIVILVLFILAVLVILGFYRCPLRMLFGIPCPLCGISRAFLCLFTGHFAKSFYYHPLWPIAVIAFMLFVLDRKSIIHLSRRQIRIGEITVAVLLVICYIIRHIMHSPVVEIHFDESLIYSYIKPLLP